jgi:hypothetical protein
MNTERCEIEARGTSAPGGDSGPVGELAGWLARTVTAALLLGAGVVWLRLLAGALRRPLAWPGLVLVAVAAIAAVAVARLALQLKRRSRRNSLRPRSAEDTGGRRGRIAAGPFPAFSFPSSAQAPAGEVIQQLVRTRLADGSERLAGWLRVALEGGQRSANIHVAFCPPFARSPQVRVQQREGPSSRVKLGQSLPYGARLDLKLAQAAEGAAALVLEILVLADAPENESKTNEK